MKSYLRISRAGAALAAMTFCTAAVLSGCGSEQKEQPLDPCGDVLTGTDEASPWVTQHTGVATYRYRARPADLSVEFDLLDADEQILGVLTVSSHSESEGDPSFMRAHLAPADGPELEMEVREGLSPEGHYRVLAQMERDGEQLALRADFGEEVCTATEPDADFPSCVGGLDLTRPGYALPSCGWSREHIGRGDEALTSLTYFAPHQSGSDLSSMGGLRNLPSGQYATLEVLDAGRLTEGGDVEKWLGDLGADQLLGTAEEQLLTLVYLDAPWRGEVQEHANYCKAPDVFPERKFSQCASTDVSDDDSSPNPLALIERIPDCLDDLTFGEDPEGFDFGCKSYGCLGWLWGDPHLSTHDGLSYDFQGAGEYIIAQSLDGEPWSVQARFEPVEGARDLPACRNVTVATAVATQVGERRVAFYADGPGLALYIDGQPFELGSAPLDLPQGARVERDGGSEYIIAWPSGEQMRVGGAGSVWMEFVLPAERSSAVAGLLGYFSSSIEDDFRTRDGQVLTAPLDYDQLYDTFGDSWKVEQDETLFDYFEASGPQDFYIADFPQRGVDFTDLPAGERDTAREVCLRQGVRDPHRIESCILDYVCMQSEEVAAQSAQVDDPVATSTSDLMIIGQIREVESLAEADMSREEVCPIGPMAYLVPEGPSIELTEPLELDKPQMTLAAGETVRPYFLHLAHLPELESEVRGQIVFGKPLGGVLISAEGLSASAATLGLAASYPNEGAAGLESGQDTVLLEPDGQTLSVSLDSQDDADQLRVILVEGGI